VNLLGAIEKPPTAKKLKELLNQFDAERLERDRAKTPSFSADEIAEGLRQGQFDVFFQPKVEMRTRRIVGAEAMARWHHREIGIVGPQAFITMIENNGLIEQLTDLALTRAAFYCALWQREGLEASVSVNLSIRSLDDVALAERMVSLVDGQGLEPRHVTFEVTESVATGDLGKVLENLSRLRMKGFGLSIDDYGTGYSSMERLSRVPFTELKVDQSFVRNAPTQAASRAVLESSLEMAQKLGIIAVAEGIETQVEWDLLRALDCPVAQGYFIGKPMEAGEFLDWTRMRRQFSA
jgi:EAL domain-containing protein (putative c-di-GMP-specific phosphodiesterase class I)